MSKQERGTTMASKGNIRSMRFSDAMIEIIEQQAGDTFTAKFEALVTKCAWELPQKKQELKRIQEQIDQERKTLSRIRKKAYELENQMYRMTSSTEGYVRQLKYAIESLEKLTQEE